MLNKWDTEHLPDKCLPSSFPWDGDKGFPSLADDRWRIWKDPVSRLGQAIASSVGFFLFLGTSESRQGFGGFLLNPFLRDSFLLFLWFWPNRADLYILSCVLSKNQKHHLCLPAILHFCSDKLGWEGREGADEKCSSTPQWCWGDAWRLMILCNHYCDCCSLSARELLLFPLSP